MPDFIDSFVAHLDGVPTPDVFKLWSGITCVSGALERRVWVETARGVLFPNLYTMLIGPPGSGKTQAISRVHDLWSSVKDFKIAPDSWTSASMLDSFLEAKRVIIDASGRCATEFHSQLVAADEFVVFCPAYDLEFLGRLTKLFDNPPRLSIRRKYLKEEVIIPRPYLTMLTGVQPDILRSLFPEEAWGGGFTSRLIMIYSGEQIVVDLFGAGENAHNESESELSKQLKKLSKLYGKFFVESSAGNALNEWWRSGAAPKPVHTRLSYYNTRRGMHALKLSLISAASRAPEAMIVTEEDVKRGLSWLLDAEMRMPDIFRAMSGRGDAEIIEELHLFVIQTYMRSKKSVPRSVVVNFLASQVPSEKVWKILEIAIASGKLRIVGDFIEPVS